MDEPSSHPIGEQFGAVTAKIISSMNSVIEGKDHVVRTTLRVLLAGGHLLIEDVPGVGKTLMARALAKTVGGSVSRIQFTPDLLPSDVTGVSVFHQERHSFEFRPGPIFAHIVIGDEINRASAKTQSALLECMEEHQVTVDGTTHRLQEPFMVVATQNPAESEGTYPLPEAQRDRFMARITMGYPDVDAELDMLQHHIDPQSAHSPLHRLAQVTSPEQVLEMMSAVAQVHVSDPVARYVVALGRSTRDHPEVRVGASPRSLLQLLRAAKAEAALCGRTYVTPHDVMTVAPSVLAHRLILQRRGTTEENYAERVVAQVLRTVPAPIPTAHN